jgi:hypothetical protein
MEGAFKFVFALAVVLFCVVVVAFFVLFIKVLLMFTDQIQIMGVIMTAAT